MSDDDAADPSSLADGFEDMLRVNEDMLLAAAECHGDRDVDGALAYQRLLHRNLMEMANFVDALFGVYTTSSYAAAPEPAAATPATTVTEAPAESTAPAESKETAPEATVQAQEQVHAIEKSSVLLATLEAEEKLRDMQRSKKRWMKSRHQVREEEAESATLKLMQQSPVPSPASAKAKSDAIMTPHGVGLMVPSSYGQFISNAADLSQTPIRAAPMQQSLASDPLAPAFQPITAATAAAAAAAAALAMASSYMPPVMSTDKMAGKLPLPSANPYFNMMFPMAPFMYPPPMQLVSQGACMECMSRNMTAYECRTLLQHMAPALVLPHQGPPLHLLEPAMPLTSGRPVVPFRAPAPSTFKRMCDECRKCHWSLHRCRVTLQHTAPEWQAADGSPSKQKRKGRRSTKRAPS